MKRALVLGGGGLVGIAWETGFLTGLAEAGVDVRGADFIVGTSAGSQVGAMVASDLPWEELWNRQVDPRFSSGTVAALDMPALVRSYARIREEASRRLDWIRAMGALARGATTIDVAQRLDDLAGRVPLEAWPRRLGVVGVDADSGERVVWTADSGVDLLSALGASSALPGVWPTIPIGGRLYCDGGVYSMENADLARGYDRVLILCADVAIPTPYTLEEHLEDLRRSGARVEVVRPDPRVGAEIVQAGGNLMDPALRAPIATLAKAQGLAQAQSLADLWG